MAFYGRGLGRKGGEKGWDGLGYPGGSAQRIPGDTLDEVCRRAVARRYPAC